MTTITRTTEYPILETARQQVLEGGIGLAEAQLLEVLRLPDPAVPAALELAHQVRLKHCGEDVEVEGIISIKTGGCPEDCHFCSQSGLFDSPVRGVWLDIPELVKAAKETAATGATEFCIVAAVRGPDIKLMNQIKFAIDRINEEVDINIACSLGMLTPARLTSSPRGECTATTTTSRRRGATSPRLSPPTATRSGWRPAPWSRTPAWNCAAGR